MTQAAVLAANASVMTTPVGTTPTYSARAWVNFNGTSTVAIRASGNVTSITDNGTGDYTVNFTTAMSDANYGFACGSGDVGASRQGVGPVNAAPTTTSFRMQTININGTALVDVAYVSATFFR